jgi:hypothetical protein
MWFGPPERNTLCPQENGVILIKPRLARVRLSIFLTPWKWRLPEPFIAQDRAVTTSPKAHQVASG